MSRTRRLLGCLGVATLLLAVAVPPATAQAGDLSKKRGYVDKEIFSGLVGEDDVQIEVWLPGALLRLVAAVDPELKDLVSGLDLAQAIVVETDDEGLADRLAERASATEKKLLGSGWVRLAKVKDGGENISVMILSDDEAIHGLAVMVSESGAGGSFVFANVVGRIDLAAIQRLGEQMDIPGLDQIKVDKK